MIISVMTYLVTLGIFGFLKYKMRWDKVIAWIVFFTCLFLFYKYTLLTINGINEGFSFVWNETRIGKITIDFFPKQVSNQLIIPLFFMTILSVFYNNVFRYEERRCVFNSLVIMNFVSLSLMICAENYVQLITTIFISDILGYMILKDVDSSRKYVIYNFIADMLLFMILAMVSGKIHSLSIAELFTYEQIGRHKDFVGLVTALAIFIKIGAFSFQSYLLDTSIARFQRMSTINIMFAPLSGILLLLKLHNILIVSDLFLPLLKIMSSLTFIVGVIFFILKDNIRKKVVYFNMSGLGALMIMLYENNFEWNKLFSIYYLCLFFYNILFFKLYLYQNRTDNVSDMINAKEINRVTMYMILLLMALLSNIFIFISYNISLELNHKLPLILSILITISIAIILNHIYCSPLNRRLDYLNKNSMRALSFIVNFAIIIGATRYFNIYHIYNVGILSLFIILSSAINLEYTKKPYSHEFIQENEISKSLYYYILVLPILSISRRLWLMVDTIFSEKVITTILSQINRLSISLFFKLNKKSYTSIILFIIVGISIFIIAYNKRELP